MKIKKILATVFCAAMVLAAMSFSVFAEDVNAISDGDYIYFGNDENNKWLVLDVEHNSMGDNGMLLVLANPTEQIAFNSEKNNAWKGSNAESWCEQYVTDHFADWENEAVISTTKTEEKVIWSKNGKATSPWVYGEHTIADAKLFFLSLQEAAEYRLAETVDTLFDYGMFWLRSPQIQQISNAGTENETIAASNPNVAVVSNTFGTKGYGTYDPSSSFYARPAFNLDTARIESVTKGDDGVWTLSLVGQPVAELWRSGSAARSVDGYHLVDSFATLKDAIYAAQDGDVIVLIDDIDEGSIKLPATIRNLTIDGNNHTISNTVINAADGNFVDVQGFTVKNTVFDNSRFVLGGQREGNVIYKDLVFTDNTFKNIVATQNMSAIHMNISSEDNEYIENFTFTGNTIDGVTGSANNGVLMKSAKGNIVFTGNTIVNVANNAIQCINSKSNINLVITKNVMESVGSAINLYNVPSATLDNNLTPDGEPASVGNFKGLVKIGNTQYTTLDAAIAGAQIGDTIDLLGNTIEITESKDNMDKNKNLTFTNGTLDLTYAGSSDSMFTLYGSETLTFKNVDFVKRDIGLDAKFMCYFINIGSANAVVTFEDCDFDLDGGYLEPQWPGNGIWSSYIANNAGGKIYLTNCNIESEYANFIYQGGAVITNCTYDGYADLDEGDTAGNILNHNCFPTEISNSTINTRIFSLRNANATVEIENNTFIKASLVRISTFNEGDVPPVYIDATSSIEAQDVYYEMFNDASTGTITSSADSVEVQFVKADVDATGADNKEDEDIYNINLVGAKSETINRLNSVDLTFILTNDSGKNVYEIIASNDEVVINNVSENRYEFHYDGKTDVDTDTANTITIGQVKLTGYGTYDFAVDAEATTNVAHATTLDDNIVDTYLPNGDTTTVVDGELVIDKGITDVTIKVPTRALTIKVDFPNAVEKKVEDYQQMKVTVSGGDLEKAIEIKLGDASYTETVDLENEKAAAAYAVTVADGYTVEVTDALTLNTAYTVTVEGAGYRTYRYTVTMTGDKVLNFWNNVKDNETAIEEGKKTAKVTYLAGDIVKDSLINVYDLSAVVSYFGETELVGNNNTYAKYDLNRDGKIDSKDVAYVLVSWGK